MHSPAHLQFCDLRAVILKRQNTHNQQRIPFTMADSLFREEVTHEIQNKIYFLFS